MGGGWWEAAGGAGKGVYGAEWGRCMGGETSSLRSREQGKKSREILPGAIAGAEGGEGGRVGAERWRPAPAPS